MFPAILQRSHAVGFLEVPGEMAAVAEACLPSDFLEGLTPFRQARYGVLQAYLGLVFVGRIACHRPKFTEKRAFRGMGNVRQFGHAQFLLKMGPDIT